MYMFSLILLFSEKVLDFQYLGCYDANKGAVSWPFGKAYHGLNTIDGNFFIFVSEKLDRERRGKNNFFALFREVHSNLCQQKKSICRLAMG